MEQRAAFCPWFALKPSAAFIKADFLLRSIILNTLNTQTWTGKQREQLNAINRWLGQSSKQNPASGLSQWGESRRLENWGTGYRQEEACETRERMEHLSLSLPSIKPFKTFLTFKPVYYTLHGDRFQHWRNSAIRIWTRRGFPGGRGRVAHNGKFSCYNVEPHPWIYRLLWSERMPEGWFIPADQAHISVGTL